MKRHWRVLIIDDHAPSRAAVAEAVTAQGGQVVGNGSRAEDVLRLVDKHRPDVTVLNAGSISCRLSTDCFGQAPPMSPDLVRRFAELVAEPRTPASYIDRENKKAGTDSLEAASGSRRAYFVVVRDTILAIDCDRAERLLPVLDEIVAQLVTDGLVPVVVLSGGEGRRHLFCLILDPRTMHACKERVSRLGHGQHLEVRATIRPPLSPHRLGQPVALLSPEDPAEALAALTPRRPKPLAPKWMTFLRHGAPKGQRSGKIQGFAQAAVNTGWTFGEVYWAMMNPANRGGEKAREEPDPEGYLERSWKKAVARARRSPPVQDRAEALALIARMRRRVETWPWPTRAGETSRRVLSAYLNIAARTGKLVFAASVREVADLAEVSIGTAVKATRWLRHERWLRLHRGYQRGTTDAAVWRVRFPHGAALPPEQVRRLTLQGLSVNTHYLGGHEETVHGTGVMSRGAAGGTESVMGTGAGCPRRLLRRADQPLDPEAPRLRLDRLAGPAGLASEPETESVHGMGLSHELWRAEGLGARAGGLYRRLAHTQPISATALALELQLRTKTVLHQLRRLNTKGLAVKTPAGWLRGDADLDAVATALGVAGKGAAQREAHTIQRIKFKQRLDAGNLRPRKDRR